MCLIGYLIGIRLKKAGFQGFVFLFIVIRLKVVLFFSQQGVDYKA